MKIAIISTMDSLPWGGSEYLWAATAEEAIAQGHEVLISIYDWSTSHPIVKNLQKLGARILPRARFIKPQSLFIRGVNRLSKSINREVQSASPYQTIFDFRPDVICISQGNTYDTIHIPDLRRLLYSYNIPYTVICHFNSDSLSLNDVERESISNLFSNAQQVAFVAKNNHQIAERHLASSITNSIIIKNPVNLNDKSLVKFPTSQMISFACVARLETEWKGQDTLLEVLSTETWKSRDWICRFYGSGPDHGYIKALTSFYQLSDRIKIMGHVNDVRSIWAENHILLLPSRGEGTPLALIEAMICGRPSVVTDIGGNSEWIAEGKTGFVAEAPTTRSINAALDRAWQTQDKWQSIGKSAHESAMAELDLYPEKTLLGLLIQQCK